MSGCVLGREGAVGSKSVSEMEKEGEDPLLRAPTLTL